MPKYYVYIWFKVENGEVFYVGKGCGNRVTDLKGRNKWFLSVRAKYECDYRIVEYFDNEQDALDYEKKLGLWYKERGEAVCSLMLGGVSKVVAPEVRTRISEALRGNIPWNKGKAANADTRAKLSEAHKGKRLSAPHKAKISDSLRGHKVSDGARAKIAASTSGHLNHNFGKKESEEAKAKRSAALKGHECSETAKAKIAKANGKSVLKIDKKTGEILGAYQSAMEAAKECGVNNSKISRVCRGERKTAGGYVWKYNDTAIPC